MTDKTLVERLEAAAENYRANGNTGLHELLREAAAALSSMPDRVKMARKRTFKVLAHLWRGKLRFADQDTPEPMDRDTTVYIYGPSKVFAGTLTIDPPKPRKDPPKRKRMPRP
jgi:hypothetical protein